MSPTAAEIETANHPPTPQDHPRPGNMPSEVIDSDAEAQAEQAVFRDAGIGAVIGVLVFAPLYMALVTIALVNHGTPLVPPMLMAAGVGMLAGVFVGGWAGTLVGANTLEKFEHANRPKHTALQPDEQTQG